jgi:hypothetical protein
VTATNSRPLPDSDGRVLYLRLLLAFHSSTRTIIMDTQNEVVDFYRHELARALNEQSFGVSRSNITNFAENGAEATITLLEGQTINVVLSSAGYQVGLFPVSDDGF